MRFAVVWFCVLGWKVSIEKESLLVLPIRVFLCYVPVNSTKCQEQAKHGACRVWLNCDWASEENCGKEMLNGLGEFGGQRSVLKVHGLNLSYLLVLTKWCEYFSNHISTLIPRRCGSHGWEGISHFLKGLVLCGCVGRKDIWGIVKEQICNNCHKYKNDLLDCCG